jgi:uncharacterized protein YjiS (DUF1127 family)
MDHSLPHSDRTRHRIGLRHIAGRMLHAIHRALQRSRQRRAVAQLSDDLLRDIGLTREDIARESAKPFWR